MSNEVAMRRKRLFLMRARKAAGFTQEELAYRLGVDRSTVGRWETGETEPQPWLRPKLGKALGVTRDALSTLLEGEVNSHAAEVPRGLLNLDENPDEQRHLAVALDDARRYADRSVGGYFHPKLDLDACMANSATHGPTTLERASASTGHAVEPDVQEDSDVRRREFIGAAVAAIGLLQNGAGLPRHPVSVVGERDPGVRAVGHGDLDAVRDMVSIFTRVDQRRGGGHARTAVVQYLTSDVAGYLRGSYADDQVCRAMFCAASELAYLAGWMAFDNTEHSTAQQYFALAMKLAAEADDPPMTGHVLRAMAHQAVDLGHYRQGLELATAALDGQCYMLACPRERALLGVVHARALGATGQKRAAAAALIRAEDDLAVAESGDDEPSRMFFFGEASLAHETACTLRDTGDLPGALREFHRSVRTRKAATFTRTHVVTLGYLGSVQARSGNLDEACATWSSALNVMDGINSGRARKVATDMRSALSSFRHQGIPIATELDARASAYLAAAP